MDSKQLADKALKALESGLYTQNTTFEQDLLDFSKATACAVVAILVEMQKIGKRLDALEERLGQQANEQRAEQAD